MIDVQALDLGALCLAEVGIQRAERLVHQERRWPPDQRPRQRDALLVAALSAPGRASRMCLDLEQARDLGDPLVHRFLRLTLGLERKGDIVPGRHVRVEREELEHEGDVALAGVRPGHVAPVEQDRAAGGRFQPGDHAQGGRLAAARRPQQDDELAIVNGQVHRLDGVDLTEFLLDLN